jgi:hypothetical protein
VLALAISSSTRQNPDLLTSPDTDYGSIPNLKFSFSLAHNRLLEGGWAREVTIRELPAAISMAGVNMRLGPGVVRELHWHKEAEWAYILKGMFVDRCRQVIGVNPIVRDAGDVDEIRRRRIAGLRQRVDAQGSFDSLHGWLGVTVDLEPASRKPDAVGAGACYEITRRHFAFVVRRE